MKAGNVNYSSKQDIPDTVPVFPLPGALLLPGGQMPLNIFEPRYIAMIDDALAGNRVIGMFQPSDFGLDTDLDTPRLCEIGCLGRITFFRETGDGQYLISLSGICRIRGGRELDQKNGYRQLQIEPFAEELEGGDSGEDVDRQALESVFRRYLEANDMEVDWDDINRTSNQTLVTALCMMSPYGPAEKQALLEAVDLKSRAETLVALTEIELARNSSDQEKTLQ